MKAAAKDYLMITVGMIVVVIAVYFFMIRFISYWEV